MSRNLWKFGLAVLVSAPAVVLCTLAAAYVSYSIATESWYRDTFLAYGVKRAVLDVLLVAGVFAAGALAMRWPANPAPRATRTLWLLAIVGALAAIVIEFDFWNEPDPLFPRGAFVVPFVAWAIAGWKR